MRSHEPRTKISKKNILDIDSTDYNSIFEAISMKKDNYKTVLVQDVISEEKELKDESFILKFFIFTFILSLVAIAVVALKYFYLK